MTELVMNARGVLSIMAYMGRLRPKGGVQCRLQVRISLILKSEIGSY